MLAREWLTPTDFGVARRIAEAVTIGMLIATVLAWAGSAHVKRHNRAQMATGRRDRSGARYRGR